MYIEITELAIVGRKLHGVMEKVKIILQQNQYPEKFYDPTISNTIDKLVSLKVNQKDQEKDVASLKSNAVNQNVFIEYREISNGRFINRLKYITRLQTVITLHKMRTCLLFLKSKIEKKNIKSRVVVSRI